jgi:transposase-like protein
MPTIPRRPAAQHERERLQARRLRAAELFTIGVRQAGIARQLGVSCQAVSGWHAAWQDGETEALHSQGPTGVKPRLSDLQLAQLAQAVRQVRPRTGSPATSGGWGVVQPQGQRAGQPCRRGAGGGGRRGLAGHRADPGGWHLPYSFLRHRGLSVS